MKHRPYSTNLSRSVSYLILLLFLSYTNSYSQGENLSITKNQTGHTVYIDILEKEAFDLENSKAFFQQSLNLDPGHEYKKYKEIKDQYGYTHSKFQQYIDGIKVEHSYFILHAKNNKIVKANGNYIPSVKIEKETSLTKQEAFESYLSKSKERKYFLAQKKENIYSTDLSKNGALVFIPTQISPNKWIHKLAYKLNVKSKNSLEQVTVKIDANTGEILSEKSSIMHAHADTRYSGTREINTHFNGNNYVLKQVGTAGFEGIETLNMLNASPSNNFDAAEEFEDEDDHWTEQEYDNAQYDNAALDAHWGGMMTYDYFSAIHGRNSYDDLGTKIKIYVHANGLVASNENAFWIDGKIACGDGYPGAPGYGGPQTSLDIIAHEFAHGIFQYAVGTGDPVGNSTGINEGLSDIWGASVERFAAPEKETWLIGEDTGKTIRNMSDPTTDDGSSYAYGDDNFGFGAHRDATVLGFWFYLLSEGSDEIADPVNYLDEAYQVEGIGISKAAKIVYQMETAYMTLATTWADIATISLQAAADCFGICSSEYFSVKDALHAVALLNLETLGGNEQSEIPVSEFHFENVQAETVNTFCRDELIVLNGTASENDQEYQLYIYGRPLGTSNWSSVLLTGFLPGPVATIDINALFEDFNMQINAEYEYVFSLTVRNDCTDVPSTQTRVIQVHDCCPQPTGLACSVISNKATLNWDVIPGALGYLVFIDKNGPCCGGFGFPPIPIRVNTNQYEFSTKRIECFGWSVQTICSDESLSLISGPTCNCLSPRSNSYPEESIAEVIAFEPQVFPNPNNGRMNILLEAPKSSNCEINIYNSSGAIIKSINTQLIENQTTVEELDLQQVLSSGIYIFQFKTAQGVVTKKVVVKK